MEQQKAAATAVSSGEVFRVGNRARREPRFLKGRTQGLEREERFPVPG
jgi:hypothetical protein